MGVRLTRIFLIESDAMIFLYIDPGAGSMVIQAVIAAALAVPFFFRSRISSVVQRLRGNRGNAPKDSSPRD
jgi:hypothetical protein